MTGRGEARTAGQQGIARTGRVVWTAAWRNGGGGALLSLAFFPSLTSSHSTPQPTASARCLRNRGGRSPSPSFSSTGPSFPSFSRLLHFHRPVIVLPFRRERPSTVPAPLRRRRRRRPLHSISPTESIFNCASSSLLTSPRLKLSGVGVSTMRGCGCRWEGGARAEIAAAATGELASFLPLVAVPLPFLLFLFDAQERETERTLALGILLYVSFVALPDGRRGNRRRGAGGRYQAKEAEGGLGTVTTEGTASSTS